MWASGAIIQQSSQESQKDTRPPLCHFLCYYRHISTKAMFLSPSSALREPEKPIYPGKSLRTDEIRVLWLQPGKWADPIVCELTNTRLGAVEYRALSYAWGSRFDMRPIRLNGCAYSVTLNLESALKHLRVKYKDGLYLWVDAL